MDVAPEVVNKLRAELQAMAGQHFEGEAVTEQQHAMQTADLAVDAGARPALVAAALLHDIGMMPHVAEQYAGVPHEEIGSLFLAPVLGDEVATIVGYHVKAKLALVATDPGYRARLSPFSVNSLKEQETPEAMAEVQDFLTMPYAEDAMNLRRWDDLAKDPAGQTRTLDELIAIAFSPDPQLVN
jgi:gamma-butyrobetaine dioxygenase